MALNISAAYKWVTRALIVGLTLLVLGSVLVWYIYSERFTDTSERDAAFTVEANSFIQEFVNNDSLANLKYSEKIMVVNGTVSEIETADTTTNIKMIDTTSGSYIIFAFQQENQLEARKLKTGDKTSIKGSCSNGIYSSILETESITFKRCIINKK